MFTWGKTLFTSCLEMTQMTSGTEKIHTILQCLRDLTGAPSIYVPIDGDGGIEAGVKYALWMDEEGPSSKRLAVLFDCESQDEDEVTCDIMQRLNGSIPHCRAKPIRMTADGVFGGFVCGMWYRVYRVEGEVQ